MTRRYELLMRRVLLPLAACAALAAAGPAQAADNFTKESKTFDVKVGPDGSTDCRVDADIYKPNDATAANPAAAMLASNGFGGSKDDFSSLGPAYARRGYVFMAYSGLGFGATTCKITLDDPDWDGKAGSQLVSALGALPYVMKDRPGDPRVGMIGGSYGGGNQFATAGVDPRVDALNPQITWNDLSYSLAGNNTDFAKGVSSNTPGVTKVDWPVAFFGIGVGGGIAAAFESQDPSRLTPCPNFADEACTDLVKTGALGYPDAGTTAFLRHASVMSYMSRIKVPTFLAQGQSDTLFNLQESIATYRALRAQGTPVKLLFRSAGHSGGGLGNQESDSTNLEAAYESRAELEWFDYYLRGVGDKPKLDLSFLRDWELPKTGDAAPAVASTPGYPAGGNAPFYLSGTGDLVNSKGAVKAGQSPFLASNVPTGAGGSIVATITNDAPGTFASYTSAPLPQDFDLVGVPKLTLHLNAPTFAAAQSADPATHLVLFVKLFDVDEGGSATLPRDLVNAVRVADVTKPVDIELPGVVHRFAKGHRLKLVIGQGNVVRRGNNVPGPVIVETDPSAPGLLSVPGLGVPFENPADAPSSQPDGMGGPAAAPDAATLPATRSLGSCKRRKGVKVKVRRAYKRSKVVSAVVQVNGKTVKRLRGGALRKGVTLRKVPAGAFRLTVTVRTKKGRTLRSARTYGACK